ncbi:MAS3 protein [Magnaporthiopsis poae ATCC 64411]|uniref:MAS3 protein n=1 Tax=Magnaporthiopsis poae (strain ATCC 64411 / 73-15) TaxID=644358 RepID=A0A0C4DY67_MAGP6|nr:MAS3 protein [Magnaporthiopsis poae ATCC 64411]
MSFKIVFAASLLAAADLVAGHAAIVKAVGDAGGEGMALGVVSSTPRDGTQREPFQQDATRFKGAQAATFGETLGGQNNLETGTKSIMAETGSQLPQVKAGGKITMTLHQVNADGGGPYTCSLNADGTGGQWTSIKVATTPPGQNSRNRSGAASDFPLVAEIPAGQTCTGTVAGQEGVCLVRCQNAARAGPFGGVVPMQIAGTQTKEQSRRALALAVKRSDEELARMMKRAASFDITKLSPEEIQELREDGEIA